MFKTENQLRFPMAATTEANNNNNNNKDIYNAQIRRGSKCAVSGQYWRLVHIVLMHWTEQVIWSVSKHRSQVLDTSVETSKKDAVCRYPFVLCCFKKHFVENIDDYYSDKCLEPQSISIMIVFVILVLSVAKRKSVSTRMRSKLSAAMMDMLRYFHQQVLLTTSANGQCESHSSVHCKQWKHDVDI